MSNLNRYQNPEVFEQLAIEYVVGGMSGRARRRFEVLMETHFYLRAIVNAYESKFAHLVELLPDEQPPEKIWNNIDKAINQQVMQQSQKIAWWKKPWLKESLSFAAMASVLAIVLVFKPASPPQATALSAVLESENNKAVAVTKISKSDMKLTVDIMKKVELTDNQVLMLWCHPKDGGKPMMMGKLAKSGMTEMKISEEEWENLKTAGLLAVSVENKNQHSTNEPGKVLLKGQINNLKETTG